MAESNKVHFTPAKNHRFLLLDAVRGIAAVLVTTRHLPVALQTLVPFSNSILAVDLFFCLSGFVIAFSYEQRLEQKLSVKNFFIARLVRLYPLYILGAVLGIPNFLGRLRFLPHSSSSMGALLVALLPAPFMLPNLLSLHITDKTFPLDLPAWSLFFELVANLFYAILVRCRLAYTAVFALISVVCIPFLLRHVLQPPIHVAGGWDLPANLSVGSDPQTFFLGFARVGLSFSLGVLMFRLYRRWDRFRLQATSATLVSLTVVATVIAILAGPIHAVDGGVVQLAIACILFPALVLLGAAVHVNPSWKSACTFLGDFSYPLYVLHSPAMFPLYILQVRHMNLHGFAPVLPIPYIALLVPISWWIGKHYDAPLRRYLVAKLYPPRAKSAQPAVSAVL